MGRCALSGQHPNLSDGSVCTSVQGGRMPYINLKLVGKLNKEQKEKIAKEFSDTLLKVAGKPKESLYLVIDEVSGENWAKGEKFFG